MSSARIFRDIRAAVQRTDVDARLFAIIFFCFGLLFVFLTPPIHTVDESAHLYRAYQVSTLKFVPDNIANEAGGKMPSAITELVTKNSHLQDDKYRFFTDGSDQMKLQVANGKTLVEFTNVAPYPPINYIPQAAGIAIARVFTPKVLVQFYAARLFNLVFITLALALAIQLIPYGKRVLLTIGLLPMVLYLGASLSADAFVISSIFVFCAYFLRVMSQKDISTKQWLLLALLASLVALSKQTYIILALMVLVVPFRGKTIHKADVIKAFGVVAVAIICMVSWLLVIKGMNTHPVHLQNGAGIYPDAVLQKDFLLHNPLGFIKSVLGSLGNSTVTYGFLGILGVLDTYLPVWVYLVLFLLLFLSFGLPERTRIAPLSRIPSLIIVSLVAAHVVVVLVGLYVYWANPYAATIPNIQGRYFIPDLIALTPVLLGRYRHTIHKNALLGCSAGVAALSVCTLLSRFY